VFTGTADWSVQNRYDFSSLDELLTIKLREAIREEKGGTYGVSVRTQFEHFPHTEYSVTITFGCKPERVEELTRTVFDVINTLRTTDPKSEDVAKVQEIQKRERETSLKENGFWIGRLQEIYGDTGDPTEILAFPGMVEKLTAKALRETSNKFLTPGNYVRCVLNPEK
jgi:zinc protease